MIGNIQLLRAAAVYAVVIHHADDPVTDYTGYDFGSVSTSSGVDVFFVISGFVMVYTTYKRTKNPFEFWRDRAIRIVPMYWIATLCMISLYMIGFRPAELHAYELQDVISSLFFIPDVRADGIEKPIIPLGWTLNYEMFFLCDLRRCLIHRTSRPRARADSSRVPGFGSCRIPLSEPEPVLSTCYESHPARVRCRLSAGNRLCPIP